MRHALDKLLRRFTSRKLLVWLTSCGLLAYSDLSSSDWVAISLVYIGSESLIDIARAWRHGT
jgi:hypothetical protein